jgi:hypothetical protein
MLALIRALDSFANHMFTQCSVDRGEHASRVLAMASRHRGLFFRRMQVGKACFGETPKPTRETRAVPGKDRSSS